MLTRKSVTDDKDNESVESAEEFDKLMALSPRSLNQYEKELDKELNQLVAAYERRMRRLNRVSLYRHERRALLIRVLRTRCRLDKYVGLRAPDMIRALEWDYLTKTQVSMMILRSKFYEGNAGRA